MSLVADTKINSFLEWRQARIQDAETIRRTLELSNLGFTEEPDLSNKQFQSHVLSHVAELQSISQYEIIILDKNGNLMFSFPANIAPLSSSAIERTKEVMRSETIEWYDLHLNEKNQKIYMGYMIPLLDSIHQNKVYAVAYLRIDPSVYLYPLLQKWPSDTKTAETLLVRREDDHVLYLNDLKFSNDAALKKMIPLENVEVPSVQAILGRIGYFEGVDYKGSLVVSEIRPIPNSDWILVAKMDKTEVFEFLYEKISRLLVILILIALLSFVLMMIVRRYQVIDYFKKQKESERVQNAYHEDIRLANEKANLYLSLVGSIVVVVGQDEKVSMINDAGCRLLGFSREEILGQNWFERFLSEQQLENVKKVFHQILTKEIENAEYFENQIVTKTGELIDVAWHNSLLQDKEGTVIGTVSSGEDITEKKRAHEAIIQLNEELEEKVNQRTKELQDSNQELEAFAYTVAHDLRDPLRAMDGFAHMIIEEFGSQLDSEAIRLLTVIRTNTHQMDQLIHDLLTMSKVSRSEMVLTDIDMNQLIRSVYEDLTLHLKKSKIDFQVATLPSCYGDYALIYQVWTNLLSNAIKYSSKRERQIIQVKGETTKDFVLYSITDNGVGFNPAYQSKLFGPFQRLHSSQEFEGTGIGLSIVERVMKRHNGKVSAKGEEGVGATFCVLLPVRVVDKT